MHLNKYLAEPKNIAVKELILIVFMTLKAKIVPHMDYGMVHFC